MFLSDLSIKRPVFAAVMMLVLVTLGIFSYRRLSIDMYPNVEVPVLSIVTKFPGASPETVERELTKRIEEVVNQIPGVRHITSTSRESVSNVVVIFNLEVKINEVSQDARAKISTIRGDLPLGIEDPVIQKFDFSAMPVASLAIRADGLSPRELTTLVEKKVKRRFENIAGVGKVELVGAAKREVNVIINHLRLEALGMGIDEVIAGLQSENVNTPLGRMQRGGSEYALRISGKPEAVAQFRDMVIGARNGRPVTLGEIADIKDGIEEERTAALVNGTRAISLDIIKQSGANTVDVANRVKEEIGRVQADLPAGTKVELVRDGSVMIRDSVKDVEETMIIGGILTILIVFCFLNSWRSTVITGLTLPISVIASFTVMNFMGMTLNILTLMALSLAIGLLIDDAIVVRENIVRHLEKGEDHFTAARNGTAEIGLAVMATTFTIVSVFIPVAYMKGIVGRFFFQFGITVSFAVMVSLFVSFTLDPMLSSRWHDPDIDRKGKRHILARVLDHFNNWFDRTADHYRAVIAWALDHRKTTLSLAALAFLGGLLVFFSLQSSFFPEVDDAEFQLVFKSAPEASLEETRGRLEKVLAVVKVLPEVKHTYATIGAGEAGTVREASIYVKLSEKKQRKRSQKEIERDLRRSLGEIPGIIPSIMELGRMDNQKPLLINIRGDEIALLKSYAADLKQRIQGIRGIVDLEVTMEQEIPEFRLTVNRELAAGTGVTTDDIVRTVSVLVGGQAVSTYEDEDGDAVNLRVRLPLPLREAPEQVGRLNLTVRKPGAPPALVPLGTLVSYQRSSTPAEINRQDLAREVVVSANLDGLPLGTAVSKVREAAAGMKMAKGYRIVFSGETEDMNESFGYMAEALLLAVILVYFVLCAQFESFISPLAIMLSLPLSLVGMAGTLFLTGDTINIMSLIGLIMLMGLVTKNAILLVDFAQVLRSQGMERGEAIITAGMTRLRPIMMTTLAMIFGMLPLALGLGPGAEVRAPMARAVIGGLITSTLLTLLVVPVMYSWLDDLSKRFRRIKKEANS
jgi:HAE1 family hydrophobic/amphiphilic exporter-1